MHLYLPLSFSPYLHLSFYLSFSFYLPLYHLTLNAPFFCVFFFLSTPFYFFILSFYYTYLIRFSPVSMLVSPFLLSSFHPILSFSNSLHRYLYLFFLTHWVYMSHPILFHKFYSFLSKFPTHPCTPPNFVCAKHDTYNLYNLNQIFLA